MRAALAVCRLSASGRAIALRIESQQFGTLTIRPGSPWENPHIESFHDKLRDEFLNRELFDTLRGAQVALDGFRREYNTQRPHSSLGYLTPVEFATKRKAERELGPCPRFAKSCQPNPNNPKPNPDLQNSSLALSKFRG